MKGGSMGRENGRRMTAKDVMKLEDGELVAIKRDQRSNIAKHYCTTHYRVTTRNGLKVLIRTSPPEVMRTIRDRPGFYYCTFICAGSTAVLGLSCFIREKIC